MPDTETKTDNNKIKQKKTIKHPHWRKFGKVMLWLIIIFSTLGGVGYYAFSSGWVEKNALKSQFHSSGLLVMNIFKMLITKKCSQ